MKDIKVALQAEIENMESACDEIPFGLDEEDEQCLWVMREALKQITQRDAQIAALEENLNSCLITVAKYSGPDAAPPAPFVVQRPKLTKEDDFYTESERLIFESAIDEFAENVIKAGGSVADE